MIPSFFLIEFNNRFSEETRPWVIRALRQERVIWESLESTEFGKCALETKQDQPANWSPASLSLLALNDPTTLNDLLELPLRALDPALQQRASRLHDDWQNGAATKITLPQAGLVALALRERRRLSASWQGLSIDLATSGEASSTILACLYGMCADPQELLAALLAPVASANLSKLALHALLSQPLPEESQSEILESILLKLDFPQPLPILKELVVQRPTLAQGLAQHLINYYHQKQNGEDDFLLKHSDALHKPGSDLSSLSHLLEWAELYRLAGKPGEARPLIVETLKSTRRLQGYLSAQLAQTIHQAPATDQVTALASSLEAWKQAAQLVPDSPVYSAGLALNLLEAGRLSDAQAYLSTRQNDMMRAPHPTMLLVNALLQARLQQTDAARQAASQALKIVETNWGNRELELSSDGFTGRKTFFFSLAQLLFDLDQPSEAARAAQLALDDSPLDPDLLVLQARAYQANRQPARALSAATIALALKRSDTILQRLVIECLEATGEWHAALHERAQLLETCESPAADDLRLLAICALKAGQPNRAIQVCKQVIDLDPNDGLAFGVIGEANLALGEPQAALESFKQATRYTPHSASLWLALAQAYRLNDQETKALEALRAGSQAAPDSAEIHLALGEACLEENAPTQALVSLRRAAAIVDQSHNRDLLLTNRIALQLGQTLRQLGHLAEARQVLERAYQSASQAAYQAAYQAGFSAPSEASQPDPALVYAYAQTLIAVNELAPAIPLLESVVAAMPDEPAPLLDLAHTLLKGIGQPAPARRALPMLRRVLHLTETGATSNSSRLVLHDEALALLAEALRVNGDLPVALEFYQKALDTPLASQLSWRAQLHLGLGQVALALGQIDTAVAALQEAAQTDPLFPGVQRSLSEAYLANGLIAEAFDAARAALQQAPLDLDSLAWFAEQSLHIYELPSGSQLPAQAEAIQALSRATQLAPQRTDLLLRLGQVQMQAGNHQAAAETFRRLATIPTEDDSVTISQLYQGAQNLRLLGATQDAVILLEKALDMIATTGRGSYSIEGDTNATSPLPATDILEELASAHRQAGDFSRALQVLDQAIALNPVNPAFHLKKGDLLLETGQTQAALACLENALRLSPADAHLHLRTALLLKTRGDLWSAFRHAVRALELAEIAKLNSIYYPSASLAAGLSQALLQPKIGLALLNDEQLKLEDTADEAPEAQFDFACQKSELYLELGETAQAAAAMAELGDLASKQPRSLAIQVLLAIRTGEPSKGKQYLASLLPTLPAQTSITALQTLAEAAIEVSAWETAFSLLQQVQAQTPFEPRANLQMARLLVQRAEAQHLYNELEVIHHAPGMEALNDDSYQTFEKSIQAARDTIRAWQTPEPLAMEIPSNQVPNQELALTQIARWQARGRLAFQPNLQNTQELEAITTTAEDAAALIWALSQSGEQSRAVKVAQAFPTYPQVLLQTALLLKKGNSRQALSVANRAFAAASERSMLDEPVYAILQAHLAFLAGDSTTALQAVVNALSDWPDEPRWHVLAANILLAMEDTSGDSTIQAAIIHLQQAMELELDYSPHYLALGKAYLKYAPYQPEAIQSAITTLEHGSQVAPESADIWLALAQAQQAAGDLEQAAASAEAALERSVDPIQALVLCSAISLQAGDARGALNRIQSVLRIQPEFPHALQMKARALDLLNQPEEALEVLDKAIPLVENPVPLQLDRARLLRKVQGSNSALAALQDLVTHNPHDPCVLAALADELLEGGQAEAALQVAKRALQINQGQLKIDELARLHYRIGQQLRLAGQLDQAIHHLTETIQMAPCYLQAYLELGMAHHERRQYVQALQVYKQAIEVAPEDARPYYLAGLTMKENKDYLGAETMLRRSAQLDPQDVGIHRQLGAVVALNLVHNRRQAPIEL